MKSYWQRLNEGGGKVRPAWFTFTLAGNLCYLIVFGGQPANPTDSGLTTPITNAQAFNGQTPIDLFRHLLSASPAERTQLLADKPQAKRMVLLAKIAEYSAMSEAERELRLHVLQLRWYLEPLMEQPAAKRSPNLANIPLTYRKLVEARLKDWDLLPPPLQRAILEGETIRQYFIRWEASKPAERQQILADLPPANRKELEDRLVQWKAMSPAQRNKAADQFNHFFELTEDEQHKTLEKTRNILTKAERQEMEQVLATFQNLRPDQRQYCIEAFRKFANLPPQERERFLVNAERWREISPEERQTWRDLVTALTPPLPPGMPLPAIPPPLPDPNQ